MVDEENVHCYSAGDLVSGKNAILQGNDKIASRTYTSRHENNEDSNYGVVENDAKDGEESAPKSVDDSENASNGGEDILGSDYVNGDGCSHEDNEEDVDHEDNEGKEESEGEVGEMVDAPDAEEGDSFALSIVFWSCPSLCQSMSILLLQEYQRRVLFSMAMILFMFFLGCIRYFPSLIYYCILH